MQARGYVRSPRPDEAQQAACRQETNTQYKDLTHDDRRQKRAHTHSLPPHSSRYFEENKKTRADFEPFSLLQLRAV